MNFQQVAQDALELSPNGRALLLQKPMLIDRVQLKLMTRNSPRKATPRPRSRSMWWACGRRHD